MALIDLLKIFKHQNPDKKARPVTEAGRVFIVLLLIAGFARFRLKPDYPALNATSLVPVLKANKKIMSGVEWGRADFKEMTGEVLRQLPMLGKFPILCQSRYHMIKNGSRNIFGNGAAVFRYKINP